MRAKKLHAFSASRFFACLRGKPNTLRCCFPLFPRRVARERGSPLPRKSTPFRLRCAPCGTVVPLKVTLGKSAILPRFIELFECSVTLPLALPSKIHIFRPRSCDKSHSFGKCARQVLEVTASKISIFNAFIKLLIFAKSGSPFFFLGAASRCQPQRLRCAALRLYEQTFHFYTKDMFAYPFIIFVRRAMLCHCFL